MPDPQDDAPPEVIHVARPVATEVPTARPVGVGDGFTPPRPADSMLLRSSTPRVALVDVGLLICGVILVELLSGLFLGFGISTAGDAVLSDEAVDAVRRELLWPSLGLRAVGASAVVWLILRLRRQELRSVGLVARGFGWNVLIGVAGLAALFCMTFIIVPLVWFLWPDLQAAMEENASRITEAVPHLEPVGFLVVTILVAFYEELLFRGFLMTRLRRVTNSWVAAVVLSTAIFTSLHAIDQVLAALVPIMGLSLVFSLLTIWRRSLVPAMVAHTLWNFGMFLALSHQAGPSWAP